MNDKSIVLAASDAGWINGHTYALFGPLSFGATSILLESPLILLNESLLNKIIYELKVSILYLPVTLIRILKSTLKLKIYKKFNKINRINGRTARSQCSKVVF